ncbi:MAG: transposase [Planctomycetota bacterium]
MTELSSRFEVVWLPPYCPELNDFERIWKYVKGASLANYDFGHVGNFTPRDHRGFR